MRQRQSEPPPVDRLEAELQLERREILRDTLDSRGWSEVIRPALLAKADRIARTLAISDERGIEAVRLLQGKYRCLLEIAGLSVNDVSKLFEAGDR